MFLKISFSLLLLVILHEHQVDGTKTIDCKAAARDIAKLLRQKHLEVPYRYDGSGYGRRHYDSDEVSDVQEFCREFDSLITNVDNKIKCNSSNDLPILKGALFETYKQYCSREAVNLYDGNSTLPESYSAVSRVVTHYRWKIIDFDDWITKGSRYVKVISSPFFSTKYHRPGQSYNYGAEYSHIWRLHVSLKSPDGINVTLEPMKEMSNNYRYDSVRGQSYRDVINKTISADFEVKMLYENGTVAHSSGQGEDPVDFSAQDDIWKQNPRILPLGVAVEKSITLEAKITTYEEVTNGGDYYNTDGY